MNHKTNEQSAFLLISDQRKHNFAKLTCYLCQQWFDPVNATQKYCSIECREKKYLQVVQARIPKWDKSPRLCKHCGDKFLTAGATHVFCSGNCRNDFHKNLHASKENKTFLRSCLYCDREFQTINATKKFCDISCRELATKERVQQQKTKKKKKKIYKTNFTNFNDLHFLLEHEFAEWFRHNFSLFGIKRLVKLDRWFPDCRAELFDGRYIDIELEYHAKNFIAHHHDKTHCDLIISFVKNENQQKIGNIPIISIFTVKNFKGNGNFNPESKRLTPFFEEIIKCGRRGLELILVP